MKKTLVILIVTLFFSTNSFGQRVVFEGQYIQISPGIKTSTLYDAAISEKHLKGLLGSVNLAYVNNKPNKRWWVELGSDYGYYNFYEFPKWSSRAANHINGSYDLGFVAPLYKFNKELVLWGGPGISGSYTYNQVVDYSNSQDNYTFLNSLGYNSMLHYVFNLFDRWWSLEWNLHIPVMTYYMRPGYSVNWPDDNIGNSELTSFNKFFELDSKLKLVYPLQNENKLSLEYRWNYYDLKGDNRVQQGSHALFLTLNFRLNKN